MLEPTSIGLVICVLVVLCKIHGAIVTQDRTALLIIDQSIDVGLRQLSWGNAQRFVFQAVGNPCDVLRLSRKNAADVQPYFEAVIFDCGACQRTVSIFFCLKNKQNRVWGYTPF